MSLQIAFVMNPTSWNTEADAPWPGGMADALVQPIVRHLERHEFDIVAMPVTGDVVNVYYTHRSVQKVRSEPGRRSVFVSHGIADKNWRTAHRLGRGWDWVFVSGPAWVVKLTSQGMEPGRICEVGYTKLDPLFDGVRVPRRDRIRVLYAPTHGGGGERDKAAGVRRRTTRTSWWYEDDIVAQLDPDEFEVTVAPHPRHRPDKRATLDEYRDCDVVIADGGSTIYEAWALDLPVVFPTWLTGVGNRLRSQEQWTFEAELYSRSIGYHAMQPGALVTQVRRAAAHGITREEQSFVETILPRAHRGVSGLMHAEALRGIAGGADVPHVAGPPSPVRYRNRHGVEMVVAPGSQEHRRFEASARWTRVADTQQEVPV